MLKNPRRERFAQELAKGKTQLEAYEIAGYKPNRSHAAKLANDPEVMERMTQIVAAGARRAEISVAFLTKALMEDRKLAYERGQAPAAVAATQAIAKLHGLWVDRSETRALNATIDLNKLNDEQLAALQELLAAAEGNKPASERDSRGSASRELCDRLPNPAPCKGIAE